MDFLISIDPIIHRNLIFAISLLTIAIAWLIFRRSDTGQRTLGRYLWLETIASFILIPLTLFSFGSLTSQFFILLELSDYVDTVNTLTWACLYLAVTIGIGRIIEVWIIASHADEEDETSSRLPQLVRLLLYGLCIIIGLAVSLTTQGYRPTELYLSTGVVAAILVFATQQTLGDFFAGLTLSLESPFKLGDWLVLEDGSEGSVIDINWRTTRLRQWDNSTLVVPNSVIAKTQIKNFHDRNHRFSPWYMVQISSDYDPPTINVILLEAALRCKRTLSEPLPTIRLIDATKSPYTYSVWVHFPNYVSMFAGREELFREIHNGLNAAGIQIAVDIQEIRHQPTKAMPLEPPSVLIALKSLDFASFLDEDELCQIASSCKRVYFDLGTVILDEDEKSNNFNILSSGMVDVSIRMNDGKRRGVEQLKSGQYFGLTAMLTGELPGLRYTATTEVSVIRIDIGCLRSVLKDRQSITEQFAKLVEQRMQRAENARMMASDSPQTVTFQDLVKRVERAFRHHH